MPRAIWSGTISFGLVSTALKASVEAAKRGRSPVRAKRSAAQKKPATRKKAAKR